jgi:hypothetical protein
MQIARASDIRVIYDGSTVRKSHFLVLLIAVGPFIVFVQPMTCNF